MEGYERQWANAAPFVQGYGDGACHQCIPRAPGTIPNEERNIIVRTHESQSEVARLREQITLEYEAAQRGLSGLAMTASHQFITARMERMWEHLQELTQLVGADEACAIVFGEAVPREGEHP
jgi:hypothetical protein